MNVNDRILYHQIHPLKLGTDVITALVSLYFFWQHKFLVGLSLHLGPPIVVSLFIVCFFDLEAQRQSAFGRYLNRTMTRKIEAVRFAGDITMVLGAWYRSWPVIIVGAMIILAGWLSGTIPTARQ